MEETIVFAGKIARAMNDLRSSHVYFILQQAYPEKDEWEWSDFQDLLNRVIQKTEDINGH